MNLTVTVKNLGDLAGSQWKIAADPQMQVPTILLEMETAQESVQFGDGTMAPEEFVTSIRGLVGMMAAQYFSALQYLEFQADGNIALLVLDPANNGAPIQIPNELIPEGAIRWYMTEGQVMFVVDAEMINMIPGGYGEIITSFFEVKNGMVLCAAELQKDHHGRSRLSGQGVPAAGSPCGQTIAGRHGDRSVDRGDHHRIAAPK